MLNPTPQAATRAPTSTAPGPAKARRSARHVNPNGPVNLTCTACGQPFRSIKEFWGHDNCRQRGTKQYPNRKQRTRFTAPKSLHAIRLADGTVGYVAPHVARLQGDPVADKRRAGRKRQS